MPTQATSLPRPAFQATPPIVPDANGSFGHSTEGPLPVDAWLPYANQRPRLSPCDTPSSMSVHDDPLHCASADLLSGVHNGHSVSTPTHWHPSTRTQGDMENHTKHLVDEQLSIPASILPPHINYVSKPAIRSDHTPTYEDSHVQRVSYDGGSRLFA
ncbi:hypothetical protein K438DRAFT_1995904 [Mycena galopus ATCC 62051]|nr:hypothetical protein K438DRAFT_1995904 [Mycena galopus ATCC 62051]